LEFKRREYCHQDCEFAHKLEEDCSRSAQGQRLVRCAFARAADAVPDDDRSLTDRIAAERPRLRRRALLLLRNRADADDLVQDCLTAALRKKASLNDPRQLRGWMLSILRNLFLARMRSRGRQIAALPIEDFADSLIASVPPEDRGPAQDLVRAMGQLSIEHRQILLLINVEGRTYREAADVLGVPVGTVMSRLARARQQFRSLMEGGTD
jgi:RNA polymerase sigma-70 factor (ECF subfamily)